MRFLRFLLAILKQIGKIICGCALFAAIMASVLGLLWMIGEGLIAVGAASWMNDDALPVGVTLFYISIVTMAGLVVSGAYNVIQWLRRTWRTTR